MTGITDELVDVPLHLQKTCHIVDEGESTVAGRGGLPKPDNDLAGTFVDGLHLADLITPLVIGGILVDADSINLNYQVV